jgi:ornithine cyclodeaminase
MVLILSEKDIRPILSVHDAIEIVEESFKKLALDLVIMPLRHVIRIKEQRGLMGFMPAYISGITAGLKIFTILPENPRVHALPTTTAMTLLIDPSKGVLLLLMDATYLTTIRTGAASAVAKVSFQNGF